MAAPSESKRVVVAFFAGWMSATAFAAIASRSVPALAAIVAPAAAMLLFALSALAYGRLAKRSAPNRASADAEPSSSQASEVLTLERRCALYAESCGFTPRQGEVCLLLVEGRSVNDIAEELYISKETVKTHAKSLYAKAGVHSRQELVAAVYAFEI